MQEERIYFFRRRMALGATQDEFLERRRISFGWEGLARLILELEFRDRYRAFADRRDRLVS